MATLPNYISAAFIITALLTLWVLCKAANYSKTVLAIALLWMALQAALGLQGFYKDTAGMPPRFMWLLFPPVLLITGVLIRGDKTTTAKYDVKVLTLLHIMRIPVELILFGLYLHKVVPRVMTFEGRNFDMLCGLTAPFIYYFGYIKPVLNRKIILAWNVICLLLLINIVVLAVISAPLSFQRIAFDQPNVALLYFPFVWLPGFIVPVVLFAHLYTIRKLL